jgi:hypothetical protein
MNFKLPTSNFKPKSSKPYQKTILDNGLRILTSAIPHTRSVSIGFFIGVGSRYESDAQSGVSHFIEHMLFKGTEKRPTAMDIAVAIEGIGGILNAGTGLESSLYWIKVAQSHLDIAIDVLVDMLRHSKFDPDEINRERLVIAEEINLTLDTPGSLVFLLINELVWPNHPLGRDIDTTTSRATLWSAWLATSSTRQWWGKWPPCWAIGPRARLFLIGPPRIIRPSRACEFTTKRRRRPTFALASLGFIGAIQIASSCVC